MSFDYGNISPQMKAGASYKDGSGMGGGGMYFEQKGKKRKDQPDDDMFERHEEQDENEITYGEIKDEDIPQDNIVNKFVNWFRIKKE